MDVYITGDTHGNFGRIKEWAHNGPSRNAGAVNTGNSLLIVLGDAGLNYYGGRRDRDLKEDVNSFGLPILSIHGNHERRPQTVGTYDEIIWNGGVVFWEPQYPNLLFAKDGEKYTLNGQTFFVVGGAYSVDKEYRQMRGWGWFPDEQPDEETKQRVEKGLEDAGWDVDYMLTHTCPVKYEPTEVFLPFIDQDTVDKSTEKWLGRLEARLQYRGWLCGHYHVDKRVGKMRFFYNDIMPIDKVFETP